VLRARACMCVCVCVCEREREFFTTKIRPEPGGDQPDSLNFFHSWIADARRVPLSLSLSLSLSHLLCVSAIHFSDLFFLLSFNFPIHFPTRKTQNGIL